MQNGGANNYIEMILTAYTDASYCDRTKIAVCGFSVYSEGRLIKNQLVIIEGFSHVGWAESSAISEALQYCFLQKGVTGIELHTDQILARDKERRAALPKFREVNEVLDICWDHKIFVNIHYVKSHQKGLLTTHEKRHGLLDQSCRTQLRKYLHENTNSKIERWNRA